MSRPSIVWCGHVLDDNPPVSVGPCFIAVARMKVAPGLTAGQKEKKNRVGAQMVIPNPPLRLPTPGFASAAAAVVQPAVGSLSIPARRCATKLVTAPSRSSYEHL